MQDSKGKQRNKAGEGTVLSGFLFAHLSQWLTTHKIMLYLYSIHMRQQKRLGTFSYKKAI